MPIRDPQPPKQPPNQEKTMKQIVEDEISTGERDYGPRVIFEYLNNFWTYLPSKFGRYIFECITNRDYDNVTMSGINVPRMMGRSIRDIDMSAADGDDARFRRNQADALKKYSLK